MTTGRCVELVLAAGLDPAIEDSCGDTSLSLAVDDRIRSLLEAARGGE